MNKSMHQPSGFQSDVTVGDLLLVASATAAMAAIQTGLLDALLYYLHTILQ